MFTSETFRTPRASLLCAKLLKDWSTGRESNPRILVLQTSALATSPPVLLVDPLWIPPHIGLAEIRRKNL
jgi:hypothetical protein